MIATASFLDISGTTLTDIQLFNLREKAGKIDLNFQDQTELDFAGAPQAGQAFEFEVYESDDGSTWTKISGASAIALAQGGQQRATVQSQKSLIKIQGRVTTAGGGKVRLDMSLNGKPYFGQADLGIIGKSGYGSDFGVGEGSTPVGGLPGTWPE